MASQARKERRKEQLKHLNPDKLFKVDISIDASLLDKLEENEQKALNDLIKLATLDKSNMTFFMTKPSYALFKNYIYGLRVKYNVIEKSNPIVPIKQ